MGGDAVEVHLARDEGEIEEAKQLRLRVFSQEQGVPPEADIDGLDPAATHLVALRRGSVVATCRLRFPQGHCKLERMVVEKNLREIGIGRELLAEAEREARRQGASEMILHAQRPVEGFYAVCGYTAGGDTFLEEGIPHMQMRKRLAGDAEPA
ncbi:MAG: GNAT family N-acetyltransferase [Actinomycetota bacterium]|nr:GNAT family N-acetyltransferase [Actinomycetota bacterium]